MIFSYALWPRKVRLYPIVMLMKKVIFSNSLYFKFWLKIIISIVMRDNLRLCKIKRNKILCRGFKAYFIIYKKRNILF